MFSVQGLIIMFLFGAMMYAVVEGLVQMFREGKAIKMTTITELQIINNQLDKSKPRSERFKTKRLNAIVACLNNGVSVKEISDALGLSRQRVYKIIAKRGNTMDEKLREKLLAPFPKEVVKTHQRKVRKLCQPCSLC